MKTAEYDTIIFDLDGTLVDTLIDIATAMNHVLNSNNLQTRSLDEYRYWIGAGTKNMVAKAAPTSANLAELHEEFSNYYEKNLFSRSAAYDGIHLLLEELTNQSINVCVLSNKAHHMTTTLCQNIFPSTPFKYIQGLTKLAFAKPNPHTLKSIVRALRKPYENCLMIGDTIIDINTGKNAGCDTMAVTWGYETADRLRACNPNYLIQHPSEIRRYTANSSPQIAF